ncbi:MAG: putative lipid II flippase FtsW [Moraxellaceae bacterium]|nr:putative lipid II flippase FtsW [Moraxellaceae bacterium]MDZ4386800.1 putative lipid II flippase FtsW [Moraxellaceae bacterium]
MTFSHALQRLDLARVTLSELSSRQVLLMSAGFMFCAGLIMVSSASMGVAEGRYGGAFFFLTRHAIYLCVGLVAALIVSQVPTQTWSRYSYLLFVVSVVLLVLVLIPGIGRRVNGSMRWINLGGFTIQPSEIMKFAAVLALSTYLVRRQEVVRSRLSGFLNPMIFVVLVLGLLLLEPDFGASLVIVATVVVMFYLAGAKLFQFGGVLGGLILVAIGVLVSEPYRMRRLMAFTDPWADQFSSGYQLVQSLIAFGRGDWFGVGLGHSVQKLFYLPEAHTDFVFAIYAEEFGFIGVMLMIVAILGLLLSVFRIGQRAEMVGHTFSAYVAYGFAAMLAVQCAINIGVNIGAFPTKGLTLPLVSYGGSSLVMMFVMLAVVLRIDAEVSNPEADPSRRVKGGQHVAR